MPAAQLRRVSTGSIPINQSINISYDLGTPPVNGASVRVNCPASEEFYNASKQLISASIQLFQPRYVLAGGIDEMWGLGLDSRTRRTGLSLDRLLAQEVNRLWELVNQSASAASQETQLLVWADMFNPEHNGGSKFYQ
eukprot:SAG22_NODE_848_length_6859_cov_5.488905_2_plen_138_part_00